MDMDAIVAGIDLENESFDGCEDVEKIGCWYLVCEVGPSSIFGLIDSGSDYTLVSADIFEMLADDCKGKIEPANVILKNASGSKMNLLGKANVSVTLGDATVKIEMLVAEKLGAIQLILGMDFLAQNEATVDMAGGKMKWTHGEVGLCQKPQDGFVLMAQKDVMLEPGEMQLVECECVSVSDDASVNKYCNEDMLVERLLGNEKALIGVTSAVMVFSQKILVPVMNAADHSKRILPRTPVGRAVVATCSGIEVHKLYEVEEGSCLCVSEESSNERPGIIELKQLPEHLQQLYDRSVECANEDEKRRLIDVLWKYKEVFYETTGKLGCAKGIECEIRLKPDANIYKMAPPRRYAPHQREKIEEELRKMENEGVLVPSDSPCESPVVLIAKKDGGSRIVNDFRVLNAFLEDDCSTKVKHVSDCYDIINSHEFYGNIDVAKAFWGLRVSKESQKYLAFSVPTDYRKLTYCRLPMGIKYSSSVFEKALNVVLADIKSAHISMIA